MSRKVLGVFAAAAVLFAVPASAKVAVSCTPGFWKNHLGPSPSPTGGGPNFNLCNDVDLTVISTCAPLDGLCGQDNLCSCSELITLLSAEQGSPRTSREAAQSCLNLYFGSVLFFNPCPGD